MTTPCHPWSPQDTLAVKRITSVAVSPDGPRVAFTVVPPVMTSEESGYLSSGPRSAC